MIKSKTLLIIIALLGMFMLSGCGPQINSGTVTSKNFIPEHEEDEPDMYIGDVYIPGGTYTVPDKWYVTFGRNDESDRWRTRTIQVTESEYDSYQEGDYIELEAP